VLDAEYDTSYAFWGIIGLTIYDISYHIRTKWNQLSDDKFFVNPLFGKYKIIALDYADNGTLNDFSNPCAYNRYDIEAIRLYILDKYDDYDKYQEVCEVYNEVKSIVYKDPERMLGETKGEVEQLAKSSKKLKIQYALFYASAVIEWYLNHKTYKH